MLKTVEEKEQAEILSRTIADQQDSIKDARCGFHLLF